MNATLKSIETFAKKLAEKAGENGITVSEMTEAAKSLAPYYTALKKAEAKSGDDSDDGATMSGMQEALRAAEESGNGGTISHRPRRRN